MSIKSTKKAETKTLVNRCVERLKNKDIDYKMRFIEIFINLFDISLKEGKQILNYIFYKNIRKSDREVANDEIERLFDLLSMQCITREVNNASMEELEKQDQILDAEMQYLDLYNEDRAREHKYNELLKRDYGRKKEAFYYKI